MQLETEVKDMIKDIIRRESNAKDAFDRVKEQIKEDVKALSVQTGEPTARINAVIKSAREEMKNSGALDSHRELLDAAEDIVNS